MKSHKLILSIIFLVLLSGCSSKVIRPDKNTLYQYSGEKFSKIDLTVDDTATTDTNDIVRFEKEKLQNMIEKKLEVSGLIDRESVNKVKVNITDIRIRSSFNAFMWGALAGNDHIRGDVTLIGLDNKPLYEFHVSASYALGGFAGANETRMGWLFEKFSELTLEEIQGEKVASKQ